MCIACSCVWRLSYVVDNCNVVATEHSRYGLSCTYVGIINSNASKWKVQIQTSNFVWV